MIWKFVARDSEGVTHSFHLKSTSQFDAIQDGKEIVEAKTRAKILSYSCVLDYLL